jgi:RNA-binding protein PNO1
MVDTEMENIGENHEIAMTSAATTIDPNVVQSRILQSSSLAKAAAEPQDSDDEMNDGADQPVFAKLNAMEERGGKVEYRRVRCPKHRYTPLRNDWEQILMPLVQFLKLQVSHYTGLGATFI